MAFHELNLLPFSTPKSYALLSAESKATEAANNKERLVICHYIVRCRIASLPFFLTPFISGLGCLIKDEKQTHLVWNEYPL